MRCGAVAQVSCAFAQRDEQAALSEFRTRPEELQPDGRLARARLALEKENVSAPQATAEDVVESGCSRAGVSPVARGKSLFHASTIAFRAVRDRVTFTCAPAVR
jgi:hypothetical protein